MGVERPAGTDPLEEAITLAASGQLVPEGHPTKEGRSFEALQINLRVLITEVSGLHDNTHYPLEALAARVALAAGSSEESTSEIAGIESDWQALLPALRKLAESNEEVGLRVGRVQAELDRIK